MAYKFYTKLAHASNYGRSRSASAIKYIVMHYTANKTDTAFANASYFQSPNRKASAHYFCDRTSVYQSVEDNVIAWSVGGSKYSDCAKTGGGKYYKICTNTNSISIELCSDNGVIANETVDNAIELVKLLMAKYNVPFDRVIRHFDVNGKKCIGWIGWLPTTNETLWNNFKARLGVETVKIPTVESPTIETPKVNLSGQKAINYSVQVWINEYLGGKYLVTDGLFGTQSKKHLNMCLEKALGITSRNGSLSSVEFNKITYTKVKNSKELTKVLEAYLYVRGFNPQEFSGVYTNSVKLAVKEFQRTVFTLAKDIDGLAGVGTFKKLVF